LVFFYFSGRYFLAFLILALSREAPNKPKQGQRKAWRIPSPKN
jgi:hypothetical protein